MIAHYLVATGLLLVFASAASAHETSGRPDLLPHNYHELIRTWAWEPGTSIPLALSGILYFAGLWRMWSAAGRGHGIKTWQAACFGLGWVSLLIALVSPLHPWGQVLFWPHMLQHEILMLISAPLMVLSHPMPVFLRSLPSAWSHTLGRFGNNRHWLSIWDFLTIPFTTWCLHGVALWIWHVPALFEATLHNEFIHALQHISFLVSALLFWWSVLHSRSRGMAYGMAVMYVFTTAMHSGVLGAMLTFASTAWYPAYMQTAPQWGLTAVEDQQLGGLIMWIPAGLVYTVIGLWLFAAWLGRSDQTAPPLNPMAAAHKE